MEDIQEKVVASDDGNNNFMNQVKIFLRWALACPPEVVKKEETTSYFFTPEVVEVEVEETWFHLVYSNTLTVAVTIGLVLVIFYFLDYFVQFCSSLGMILAGRDGTESAINSPCVSPLRLSPTKTAVEIDRKPMNEPINCLYAHPSQKNKTAVTQSSSGGSNGSLGGTSSRSRNPSINGLPPSPIPLSSTNVVAKTDPEFWNSDATQLSQRSNLRTSSSSGSTSTGTGPTSGVDTALSIPRTPRRSIRQSSRQSFDSNFSSSRGNGREPAGRSPNPYRTFSRDSYGNVETWLSKSISGYWECESRVSKIPKSEGGETDWESSEIDSISLETELSSDEEYEQIEEESRSNIEVRERFNEKDHQDEALSTANESISLETELSTNDESDSEIKRSIYAGPGFCESGAFYLAKKGRVEFVWMDIKETKMSITGSFFGWNLQLPLTMNGDDYSLIIELPAGSHSYKYVTSEEENQILPDTCPN